MPNVKLAKSVTCPDLIQEIVVAGEDEFLDLQAAQPIPMPGRAL